MAYFWFTDGYIRKSVSKQLSLAVLVRSQGKCSLDTVNGLRSFIKSISKYTKNNHFFRNSLNILVSIGGI